MKKIFLIIMLATASNYCFSSIAQLTDISLFDQKEDQTPLDIIIHSSDSQGMVEMNDGSKPGIQEKDFNLKDLKTFAFTVPWEHWDNDATLHIKVFKGKELIAQMNLQDRNNQLIVKGVKNAQAMTLRKNKIVDCKYDCSSTTNGNCTTNLSNCSFSDEPCNIKVQLAVDATKGTILIKSIEQIGEDLHSVKITQQRFAQE